MSGSKQVAVLKVNSDIVTDVFKREHDYIFRIHRIKATTTGVKQTTIRTLEFPNLTTGICQIVGQMISLSEDVMSKTFAKIVYHEFTSS